MRFARGWKFWLIMSHVTVERDARYLLFARLTCPPTVGTEILSASGVRPIGGQWWAMTDITPTVAYYLGLCSRKGLRSVNQAAGSCLVRGAPSSGAPPNTGTTGPPTVQRMGSTSKSVRGIDTIRAAIKARNKVMAAETRFPDNAIDEHLQTSVAGQSLVHHADDACCDAWGKPLQPPQPSGRYAHDKITAIKPRRPWCLPRHSLG